MIDLINVSFNQLFWLICILGDGLRRLYNYVSTLTILQRNDIDEDDLINDEHYIQSIATIRNAIFAFRTYV